MLQSKKNQLKTEHVGVKLSPLEKKILKRLSKKFKISMGEVIRQLINKEAGLV